MSGVDLEKKIILQKKYKCMGYDIQMQLFYYLLAIVESMCYTTNDVGGRSHCSFGDAKSLKGGSAMKKFIKAALEWLDKAMDAIREKFGSSTVVRASNYQSDLEVGKKYKAQIENKIKK